MMDSRPPVRVRHSSSLYDFVKVRVRLGEAEGCAADSEAGAPRSHVLSRFLVTRTLTASCVPYESAVKVALEVKKHLVDSDQLDVTQSRLEAEIFRHLRQRGFGEDYVARYRLLSAFHQRRRPLVVTLGGSCCAHKSSLAAQLAQRLNLSNVLQTDWVSRVVTSREGQAAAELAWPPACQDKYLRDCASVCQGVTSDLRKALQDGKAVVLEGLHVHAPLFASLLAQLAAELGLDAQQQPVVVPIFVTAQRRGDAAAALSRLDDLVKDSGAGEKALQVTATLEGLPELLQLLQSHVLAAIRDSVSNDVVHEKA